MHISSRPSGWSEDEKEAWKNDNGVDNFEKCYEVSDLHTLRTVLSLNPACLLLSINLSVAEPTSTVQKPG